jgi:ATP-dependent DNA helicase HFM1/MER3
MGELQPSPGAGCSRICPPAASIGCRSHASNRWGGVACFLQADTCLLIYLTHCNLHDGVRRRVHPKLLHSDAPFVCSAPTGSGKTTLLDLALVRMFEAAGYASTGRAIQGAQRPTAVYMAPTKALCDERHTDWAQRFSPLGLRCVELTGDSAVIDYAGLASADLILTTPEKWDAVTRSWRENQSFVRNLALLLLDEAHLINDKPRGATLEAVRSVA